jgi:DNA gyrase subunit A
MMICENGIVIRIHANQISKIGRDTQGVRIMRVENTKISNVAIAPREEDEPEEGEIAEGETTPVAEETAPVAEETTAVAQEAGAPEENGSAE